MKRFQILLLVFLLVFPGCSFRDPCDDPQNSACTRVLFIGNSYTFVNDLPKMFAELARAGGHPVAVEMSATGGWTLADHAQSEATIRLLSSTRWNFVVLQEQSQIPSVQQFRSQEMYPAARTLVKLIQDQGAAPIFFLTWAHQAGWPEMGLMDYQYMQSQIDEGYYGIAQELSAIVAPVGPAWRSALERYPDLSLWQSDGSHPSEEGTYLAACVFYAAIFKESPVNLSYRAGLSKGTAANLQTIAAETVLNKP